MTVTFSLLLLACSSPAPPKRAEVSRRPGAIMIGEVMIVDQAGRFVVVDLASNLHIPAPGTSLRSINRAGEPTAQLKAALEQKRPFIAADIVDGHPAVGDLVVQ